MRWFFGHWVLAVMLLMHGASAGQTPGHFTGTVFTRLSEHISVATPVLSINQHNYYKAATVIGNWYRYQPGSACCNAGQPGLSNDGKAAGKQDFHLYGALPKINGRPSLTNSSSTGLRAWDPHYSITDDYYRPAIPYNDEGYSTISMILRSIVIEMNSRK